LPNNDATLPHALTGARFSLLHRVACHYGDTEQEMSSTLSITSGAVFNKVLLFMLKEADRIFRRMLGLTQDSTTAAAGADGSSGKPSVLLAEQVTKAQRWRKVGMCGGERVGLSNGLGRVQRHQQRQQQQQQMAAVASRMCC
jgi:hypothetical protein